MPRYVETMPEVTPLLKWLGRKKGESLVRVLRACRAGFVRGRWIEPFFGSGAVALALPRAPLGGIDARDLNLPLVNFHTCVRDAPEEVLEALDALPPTNDKETYLAIREAFNASPPKDRTGPEYAAVFLWLNRAGFNGLYRENKSGDYNVPVGSLRDPLKFPDRDAFLEVSKRLRGATIERAGFKGALVFAEKGDVVYCDPPYLPASPTAEFSSYTAGGFDLKDHQDLARLAAKSPARVVISNHDTPAVRALYEDAGLHIVDSFPVGRSISCKGDGRVPVMELLASNRFSALDPSEA